MTEVDAYLDRARALVATHFATGTLSAWFTRHLECMGSAFTGHGHSAVWERTLAALPRPAEVELDCVSRVRFSTAEALDESSRQALADGLRLLCPWRKGPFELFTTIIDAEWRSDLKWERVRRHLTDFEGSRVLDVGCGNGYYAWRMLGAGAACVLGLDPGMLAVTQFRALAGWQPRAPIIVLPLGSATLDCALACFDHVFSMGVLYHRRDVAAHLTELHRALAPGGTLILETLVIDRIEEAVLEPADRYASMRNVHALPSPALVLRWLREAGFDAGRCVDLAVTSTDEQRRTAWMPYHSLADFLDPDDSTRTIEGYPAPCRAIFVARRNAE